MEFYNCHIHIFKEEDVPRRFLPLGLVRIMSTTAGFNVVARVLNNINPFSSNDQFDKYVRFAEVSKFESQEAIFLNCAQHYPRETKFIVMAIDMAFMDAGKVPRNYLAQLQELSALALKYPDNIIPFIHIDPRRLDYMGLLKHATTDTGNTLFQGHKCTGFKGVKLYPPLGHFADDPRLTPVYEFCNTHKLPIIAHGGPESPTYFRGSRSEIRKMMGDRYDGSIKKRIQLCGQFAHPKYYREILTQYPDVKICLAHWGSENSWKNYLNNPLDKENWFYWIRDMIQEFPNLYTDISFTLNNPAFFAPLKLLLGNPNIRQKVLFGSDYYMVKTKRSEKWFSMDFRAFLGDDYFHQIAYTNIRNFLS
ncbi:MAG: amidohydrolase family protein [Bacteroidales bacterium]